MSFTYRSLVVLGHFLNYIFSEDLRLSRSSNKGSRFDVFHNFHQVFGQLHVLNVLFRLNKFDMNSILV